MADDSPAESPARHSVQAIDRAVAIMSVIDWLRARGKSWTDIIDSAKRTGGKDW